MRADHFKLDGRRALIDAQCSGRRVREVQHAPHDIGTTIGVTVLHILAIAQVPDSHDAAQGQFAMRGRVGGHIKDLAVGRQLPMKLLFRTTMRHHDPCCPNRDVHPLTNRQAAKGMAATLAVP